MSGSGTSRLVQSQNAMKSNSQSALVSALQNANEVAKKMDKKDSSKAKKK